MSKDWVKSYYEIEGDKDTISLLKSQLIEGDRFVFTNLFSIPEELLINVDDLSQEIVDLFVHLLDRDNGSFDILSYTLKDFCLDETLLDFMDKYHLSKLGYLIGEDLKHGKVSYDTLFYKYIENHYPDSSKKAIQILKCYKREGVSSLWGYLITNFGSDSFPVECQTEITDTKIKGTFFTTFLSPFPFFKYLRETFPVKVKLTALYLESKEYIDHSADV